MSTQGVVSHVWGTKLHASQFMTVCGSPKAGSSPSALSGAKGWEQAPRPSSRSGSAARLTWEELPCPGLSWKCRSRSATNPTHGPYVDEEGAVFRGNVAKPRRRPREEPLTHPWTDLLQSSSLSYVFFSCAIKTRMYFVLTRETVALVVKTYSQSFNSWKNTYELRCIYIRYVIVGRGTVFAFFTLWRSEFYSNHVCPPYSLLGVLAPMHS